ncbi:MAG: hypothetical protein WCC60_16675 [Ilumatobacteraceae bacterium]
MEPYEDDLALGAILEALPDPVVAALEVRDSYRKQLAESTLGLEFIVSDLARWPVGSVVRVAFLDGDTALHAAVAEATQEITDNANLTLDFGLDPATGNYRRWKETDTALAAEIRVSFDMPGYWSLVGTDSTDATIAPTGPIGGSPGQRSLNLGGYKTNKPQGWQGTVRHEFLHALAFEHEHQNMRGPCSNDFRWDNDPGYVPTANASGVFVPDAQGRRPGIYTYLAGPPNQWSKAKVDHNLRTVEDPNAVAGPFDAASVMLYRFAAFFYKSSPSPCAPTTPGLDLSDGDKRGLALLYPIEAEVVDALAAQSTVGLELIAAQNQEGGGLESIGAAASPYLDRVVELMAAHSAATS